MAFNSYGVRKRLTKCLLNYWGDLQIKYGTEYNSIDAELKKIAAPEVYDHVHNLITKQLYNAQDQRAERKRRRVGSSTDAENLNN